MYLILRDCLPGTIPTHDWRTDAPLFRVVTRVQNNAYWNALTREMEQKSALAVGISFPYVDAIEPAAKASHSRYFLGAKLRDFRLKLLSAPPKQGENVDAHDDPKIREKHNKLKSGDTPAAPVQGRGGKLNWRWLISLRGSCRPLL